MPYDAFPDYRDSVLIDDDGDGYSTRLSVAGDTLTVPTVPAGTKSIDFEVYLLNPATANPLIFFQFDGAVSPAMTIRAFWRRTTGGPSVFTSVSSAALLAAPANDPVQLWIHGRLSFLTGIWHATSVVTRINAPDEELGETQLNGGFMRDYSPPSQLSVHVSTGGGGANVDAGSWARFRAIVE